MNPHVERLVLPLGVPAAAALTYGGLAVAGPKVVALPAGVAVAIVLASRPRLALAIWWLVMCAVPYWLALRVGPTTVPPQTIAAILILPAILTVRQPGLRFGDWLLIGVGVCLLIAWRTGGATTGPTVQLILQGGTAYLVGRHLVPAVGRQWAIALFAITLTVVGAWAIIEYRADWHVFSGLHVGTEGFWADLLFRGSHARSETALGHPIVLGAMLAFAVPMIVAWRPQRVGNPTKAVMLAIVFGGLLTTQSRGPLIAGVVGLALIVVFAHNNVRPTTRVLIFGAALYASYKLYGELQTTVSSASTGGEAELSAHYRHTLYDLAFQDMHPLSVADNLVDVVGGRSWRGFGSIDSTFLATALGFGWAPVAIMLAALLAVAVRVVHWRASEFQIALVAQIPVLATVALITQYRSLAFFLAGAAVAIPSPAPAPEPAADADAVAAAHTPPRELVAG